MQFETIISRTVFFFKSRYFFEKLDERDRNSSEWRSAILKEWPEDVGSFVKGFQVRHPMER